MDITGWSSYWEQWKTMGEASQTLAKRFFDANFLYQTLDFPPVNTLQSRNIVFLVLKYSQYLKNTAVH